MHLQILSDLHLEFMALDNPQAAEADVVILAGDIGLGTKGVKWALSSFTVPVIYVAGNHEFYHYTCPNLLDDMKKLTRGSHVHVLEQSAMEIAGIYFLGTTLWTDYGLNGTPERSMAAAAGSMSDHFVIKTQNGRLFTPEDSLQLHCQSVEWLDHQLTLLKNKNVVVVTHHAPSPLSIAPKFAGDSLNPAFSSNLHELIARHPIALWVHGHTHSSFDYDLEGTRVVCNPRGYQPYESETGFDLHKTVCL